MPIRVSAELAFKAAAKNRSSKWGNHTLKAASSQFILPSISPSFSISPGMSIFTIGSCFARHIEIHLKKQGYHVPAYSHRFPSEELWSGTKMSSGILNKYTPHSMLNEVDFAFSNSSGDEYLIEVDGGYLDMQCHTNRPVSRERALERREEIRFLYRESIRKSDVVVITLGLAETWWDKTNEVYLNETPPIGVVKAHKDRFFFEVMSATDTIACVNSLIEKIQKNAGITQNILITVSPIPLQRTFSNQDVLVANTYSKSVLRVAAQEALRKFDKIDYYPSFESITNSDFCATWEDDLIHVRQEAVHANVSRMCRDYQLASFSTPPQP